MRPEQAESGFASIQWVFGFALALLSIVLVANLVAMQYVRGALAAAVASGARSGAAVGGSLPDCEQRSADILHGADGLLRGPLGRDALVTCTRGPFGVRAVAEANVHWWIGPAGPLRLRAVSEAPVEGDSRLLMEDLPPSNGSSASP